MKLARKLTLALMFGVFLVLALSAYVQIRREANVFENDVQRDHQAMGRALAAAVTEVWRSEGQARALRLVEDANERERQVDIRWTWLDGQAGEAHRPRLAPELLLPVAKGQAVVHRIPKEDADILVTCAPVAVPGDRVGALELSESLAGARRYIRSVILNTAITTAALFEHAWPGAGAGAEPLAPRAVGPARERLHSAVSDLSPRELDALTSLAEFLRATRLVLAPPDEKQGKGTFLWEFADGAPKA
ncbi:uncharacterized protein SOCE26_034820 [Sorangium cellulosum]|uniref:Uncharacterized protein n=1 Tax=Sorangium cellulosum TaxID=56 RepID=A0A2L0ERW2_SORCE|nr:hypothetical protein [Sorangium cellulosum]AUX42057.1 uncharacterized protein SOCE26_034820 [Sorangium cellulosum]